jgi:hypothetical protein
MPEERTPVDLAVVKRCAAEAFNKAWEYIDRADRTQDDDDAMLAATFAQRHLWGRVGAPLEIERAEWQISRVYAVLGKGPESLRHAERRLHIVTDEAIGGFDLAFAHEAVARACAVLGDAARRDAHRREALATCASLPDKGDRNYTEAQIATIPA